MIYAPFWKRAAASIIDGIILSALMAFCLRIIIFFPIAFILPFFYVPIFESSELRATPGKYLASISVLRSNGGKLSLRDAYIRYFSSWLSGIMCGLGYLLALFTKRHQALHDLIADTIVVDEVYESNGLWNAWLDQMKYMFARKSQNRE